MAIRQDRLALAGFATFAAICLPYLFPILSPEQLLRASEGYLFLPLSTLVAWSMFAGLAKIRHPEERQFWILLGAAFACYFGAELVVLLPGWDNSVPAYALAYDLLFVGFYMAAILATTRAPHQRAGWSARQGERLVVALGTALFALGMMVYFDLLPLLVDRPTFVSRLSAFYLFLALDLSLALRLAALFWAARTARWQVLYGLVFVSALLMAIGDLLDALRIAGIETYRGGTAWDFLWYGSFGTLFVAGRLRSAIPPTEEAPGRQPLHFGSPLLTFAFLVPGIHFVLSGAGLIGGPTQRPREAVALLTMAGILVLARWHQLRLETANRALQHDLDVASERLANAEKLEAVGRLAGGVAHDFNNLLTVILGYADLLTRELAGDRELVEPVRAIRGAAERAAGLTAQLLAVGRKQLLLARPLDLDELLVRLHPAIGDALGGAVELVSHRSHEPPTVVADPTSLERAILHLAVNAREAMPNGGKLTVSTRVLDLAADQLPLLPPRSAGRYIRLELADTGVGMSEELQAHLFEPFFTTKRTEPGSGLGLATVRGIVEQSGGFVTVESAPGAGSRFRIHLPWSAGSTNPL